MSEPQDPIHAEVSVVDGLIRVAISSTVAAPPPSVWAVTTTFAGVNGELMPFCRMVEPRSLRGRTLESYVPGERATCWLLAGGIVPFDRHRLGLASMEPGVGFVEESTTWLQRRWRHERTVAAAGEGTRVTDRLMIEPRVRAAARFTAPLVARIFEHRHRRLHARFGA